MLKLNHSQKFGQFTEDGGGEVEAVRWNLGEMLTPNGGNRSSNSAKTMLRSVALGWLCFATTAGANVLMPAVLSDHMVLQRSATTAIWGKANPGEEVSVILGKKNAATKTGEDGRWMVRLDLSDSPAGPFEMKIRGSNEIKINDVMVGGVWVASGQSNMQFVLKEALGGAEEIARPANPRLRHFKIAPVSSLDPLDDCSGKWVVAGPETLIDFTAVGYYFAKTLQSELDMPVGVINATWGGTRVEAWTNSVALCTIPEFAPAVEAQLKAAREYPELQNTYTTKFKEWLEASGREDRRTVDPALFAAKDVGIGEWTTLTIPMPVGKSGTDIGAVWFRKTVSISEREAGKRLQLVLGNISGFEEIYWNGKLTASTTTKNPIGEGASRRCEIPATLVNQGENVLAIRVFSPTAPAALLGRALKAGSVSLSGEWLTRVEFAIPAGTVAEAPVRPPTPPLPQGIAGSLFNGMIHPILPYSIAGVIWYQGEGNATRAWQYRTTFPLMIQDWRAGWKQPDLPFYFCQLTNHGAKVPQPGDARWAELREAQSQALALPNTGQAVLIDIGESESVHPLNKKDAGERLAAIALANLYKKQIPYSGPVFKAFSIEKDKIRIQYNHGAGGLVARPLPETYAVYLAENLRAPLVRNSPQSELEGFAICGADKKWVWAQARIEGESVLVWSEQIPDPVAVRYAWADNPTVNLYNGAGFPAAPFRTDNFAIITQFLKN